MGCCSSDAMPDVPNVIKPDPDVNTTITAVTKRLGVFGGRDFSVHEGSYPTDSDEVKQKMWMWFNKSNGGRNYNVHPVVICIVNNVSRALDFRCHRFGELYSRLERKGAQEG